jgi:hypothetical protein
MMSDPYEPWRPDEYPILRREIVGVIWRGNADLEIQISEGGMAAASLIVRFSDAEAYQGLDECRRLMDAPRYAGALIYASRTSPYLARFRENAAGTMDNSSLTHWLVVSCNECVDVIAHSEPSVIAASP